jgi:hypothetical protein
MQPHQLDGKPDAVAAVFEDAKLAQKVQISLVKTY